MSDSKNNHFQLEGDELVSMKGHMKAVEEHLFAINKVIHEKLGKTDTIDHHFQAHCMFAEVKKIQIEGPNGSCGILEDPPGICRSCGPNGT